MNKLRQLYQGLANLDTKFANRAAKDMGGESKNPIGVMLGGTPILNPRIELKDKAQRDAENVAAGLKPTTLGQHRFESTLEGAAIGGAMLTNAGYRYGLPAAGVTLAGKGLFDLSYQVGAHFGSKADQPEEDTLTLQ